MCSESNATAVAFDGFLERLAQSPAVGVEINIAAGIALNDLRGVKECEFGCRCAECVDFELAHSA